MKTLLIIPSETKSKSLAHVDADQRPIMDYEALDAALRGRPGDQVDLLDYGSVDAEEDPVIRLIARTAGRNAALAMMAFRRRDDYDVIFTNAENVALPLSLLLKTVKKRPRHVTIGHRLSAKRKRIFYSLLQAHRQMDTIFVYASSQRDFARSGLRIPGDVLRLIPFQADHRFYRPLAGPVRENQICAAGLEWRDYPTLIGAVEDQPELMVRLAAASPWSKHSNETEGRALPSNVDARRYDYKALRELYAQSSFVVVPLYENDFQAGITTILEAMAMGKAVVVTGTCGQTDAIAHGLNGLYVRPGESADWRAAIARLQQDPTLRARLGRRARRWIEENATVDHWVDNVVAAIRGVAAPAKAKAGQPSHVSIAAEDGERANSGHRSVARMVQPEQAEANQLSSRVA